MRRENKKVLHVCLGCRYVPPWRAQLPFMKLHTGTGHVMRRLFPFMSAVQVHSTFTSRAQMAQMMHSCHVPQHIGTSPLHALTRIGRGLLLVHVFTHCKKGE